MSITFEDICTWVRRKRTRLERSHSGSRGGGGGRARGAGAASKMASPRRAKKMAATHNGDGGALPSSSDGSDRLPSRRRPFSTCRQSNTNPR